MRRIVIAAALLMASGAAWGYYSKHGAFEPGREPKPFPLKECACISRVEDDKGWEQVYAANPESTQRLVIRGFRGSLGGTLTLQDVAHNELPKRTLLKAFHLTRTGVYWCLLNEDKEPDYVVDVPNVAGNGLAGCTCFSSFALSTPDGYQFVSIQSIKDTGANFVDMNRDRRPEFIHRTLIGGEEGKDGKCHNYWVYNLLQFKGGEVVSANHLRADFPKWIWCTFKPNHQNTRQLTGEQKRRLWLRDMADEGFPLTEALAEEQDR